MNVEAAAALAEPISEAPATPKVMTPMRWAYTCTVFPLTLIIIYLRSPHGVIGMGGYDDTYTLMLFAAICLFPLASGDKRTGTACPSHWPRAKAAQPRTPATRMYYLDNLKIFMTFSVLVHHVTTGFGGGGVVNGFVIGNFGSWFVQFANVLQYINQSYFMCAFFFISAYFTSSSLAKKGVREFTRDKFMRLGLPLFVFFLAFSSSVSWFCSVVVAGQPWQANTWYVGTGPLWFVQVLLLFNFAFVLMRGLADVPSVNCPTPVTILCVGMLVGLLQGFFIFTEFTMWGIPGPCQGSLPFDILFFTAGCLAKKNHWLEDFQSMMTRRTALVVRFAAALTIVMVAIFFFVSKPQQTHRPQSKLATTPFSWYDLIVEVLLARGLFSGLMTVSISMTLVHWFSIHLNFSNKLITFLNEAAYGVYIFHPLVWPVMSWSYIKICRFDLKWQFADYMYVSSDDIGVQWVVLGWLYTIILSSLILWPLAFYIRKLPGLNRVL